MARGKVIAKYTGEFKQKVIEDMRKNKESQNAIALKYGVPRSRVQSGERIYLEEGSEGLYVERREAGAVAQKDASPSRTNK